MKGKPVTSALLTAVVAVVVVVWLWFNFTSRSGNESCPACVTSPELVPSHPTAIMRPAAATPTPLPYRAPPAPEVWKLKSADERLEDLEARVVPGLKQELEMRGLQPGAQAYLRAFKQNMELQLWLRRASDGGAGEGEGEWVLFRTYPIVALSGQLGPKLAEGDRQTPEGFYGVKPSALNPASVYHLSFNIGYPNEYDLHHQRTGSFIMVHGSDVSVGCLAMTDAVIEEIYAIVAAALEAGQSEVPVHVFPFHMTEDGMQRAVEAAPEHRDFWQELKIGYEWFEKRRKVPQMRVEDGRYCLETRL